MVEAFLSHHLVVVLITLLIKIQVLALLASICPMQKKLSNLKVFALILLKNVSIINQFVRFE